MRDTDVAWLAGIIDGEGSVSVHSVLGKYASPNIQVGMTHRGTIEKIRSLVGGKVVLRPSPNKRWKPCWMWNVYGQDASRVASIVLPYVVTKRPQITLLTMMPAGSKTYGEESNVALRYWFAEASYGLNQRGS